MMAKDRGQKFDSCLRREPIISRRMRQMEHSEFMEDSFQKMKNADDGDAKSLFINKIFRHNVTKSFSH